MQVQLLYLLSGSTEEQREPNRPMQSGTRVLSPANRILTVCLDARSACSLMHASTES